VILEEIDVEELRVRDWRLEQLMRLGYSHEMAFSLVAADADYHLIDWLLERGCSLELAARIAG
jgi:hypothetical protein